MIAALHNGFKGYADFYVKSTRYQYWYFAFVTRLFTFVTSIVNGAKISNLMALLPTPSLAATASQRTNDVNKSGRLVLVPFYNFILFITSGK
jgi:uncharacterized membrane protein YhaH (DUF805 family)